MGFTFLKRGADSAKLAQKAAADAEARRENKLFRFYLKEGEEDARITFIDGELATEGALKGYLDPPRYYEHNLYLNGTWNNFFYCPEKTNPDSGQKCPICESGDKPSLVALFTIIDHRSIPSVKDKTKVYKDQKKLLVAKPQTFELLTKQALKRGGLAGCTFEASRIGDKSAAVGSMFEFVEKNPIAELQKHYQIEHVDPKTNVKSKVTNFTPAVYEKEIAEKTEAQLRKELNKDPKGGDDIPFDGGSSQVTAGATDYSKQL